MVLSGGSAINGATSANVLLICVQLNISSNLKIIKIQNNIYFFYLQKIKKNKKMDMYIQKK